jgi:phage protein D
MASSLSYQVRTPQWVLTYQGVDITADVSDMVRRIEYIDRLDGYSSEVEIELEDHGKRWQGPWYPVLGDQIDLQIGYRGGALLVCGSFQVDQVELDGPPDSMKIRCLGTYVTQAMRTASTSSYENVSLVQIAGLIATKYGLMLIAAPAADESEIVFQRVTQRRETDLEFLERLAREHGYIFAVRGVQLVFYPHALLQDAPAVLTIARADVDRFSFQNRTQQMYGAARVSYFDPSSKQLITEFASAPMGVSSADTLNIVTRCENVAQAFAKAQAAVDLRDGEFTEASLAGPGNPSATAGSNAMVTGWGAMDGAYQIVSARHRMTRSTGYYTSIAARRVG